jgi:hypothetical protein
MEPQKNNGTRNICIALLFSLIGLAIGVIIGVRLGFTSVELSLKNDLNNFNSKINKIDEAQIKCYQPSVPFQFKESDLEKEDVKPPGKMPPIRL